MKVALVHDDLMQWGGAERLFLGIAEAFPDAPIYTSIFDLSNQILKQKFGHRKIYTSFLQRLPNLPKLYKLLLPFYPVAFEQFDFSQFEVVISSSSRFAKSVITKPETLHVCYCHTPPRFLWQLSGHKASLLLNPLLSWLRLYDQITSRRVDVWIANSTNVKNRIHKFYQQKAEVVYPFVSLEVFKKVTAEDRGYYLIISRLNKYKRIDLAVEAFNQLGLPMIIIGKGPEMGRLQRKARHNIKFLNFVSDERKLDLLSGCKALVIPGEEDFGITSIEAQALGKPVIAYAKGGALETVIDRKTGILFKTQTREDIKHAVMELPNLHIVSLACRRNAAKFSLEQFSKMLKQIVLKSCQV